MTNQKVYYPEIDALKGFTIFLVILGHAIIVFPINLHENATCLWLYNFIYSFHMPFFFCLSGFLFSFHEDYRSYLWKKVKRIAVPYLIFNLVDMVPRSMFGFLFNRPRSLPESLLSILFYGGEFWFLYVLFILYMIFPPLAALEKKSIKWALAIEGALFIWALLPLESVWILDRLRLYLFFFNTGFLVRSVHTVTYKRMEGTSPIRICALSVLMLALWLTFFSLPTPPQSYKRLISVIIALLGSMTAYTFIRWKPFCNAFARFGSWTLQLYLLNSWTLGVSRLIICTFLGVTNPAVIILFNVAVDFGLSYLFIKYFCVRFRVFRCAMGIV
ncbi:MAG: acyltransferase family protein [Oscillibacter sp.]|nr:acyltransferase family protein [Oscillibacter sp.]